MLIVWGERALHDDFVRNRNLKLGSKLRIADIQQAIEQSRSLI